MGGKYAYYDKARRRWFMRREPITKQGQAIRNYIRQYRIDHNNRK